MVVCNQDTGGTLKAISPPLSEYSSTKTVGITSGHIDVSIWYAFKGDRNVELEYDYSEFNEVRWFHKDEIPMNRTDPEMAGRLLAHAYPDRIARKRNNQDNTFLMASGKGAFFTETNTVSINEYIVALYLDGNPRNAKVFLAAPYSKQDLELDFCKDFKTLQTIKWDKKIGMVQATKDTLFGALIVEQQDISDIDPDKACGILIREIKKTGLALLPWTKRLISLKQRGVFLKNTGRFPDLPDVSDTALEKQMETWLKSFLTGVFSLKQLEKIDLESAFLSR